MKKLIIKTLGPHPLPFFFNGGMLLLRVAVSLEIAIVHGFKKIGIGVPQSESIPNPLHLPEAFNNTFAIAANIVFPFFVLIGLFTRLATLPTLVVTLTGYFLVHWNDSLLQKDTPFIYSLIFLVILLLGPGKYSIDNAIYKKRIV
ncbi:MULTISPECIES: DoxX family protein [Niastella]|uniref:DoxX family protein n=1 Tax=Niastella soli TaxID=2821487 RepID=A0ABS3YZE9_9BACT|nr:DoxX family protein [Niastella soli]MBO9202511.1 DoxX family protein [Niastella soli]